MNIVLITSSFHPVVGGAESWARMFSTGMASLGHKVVVITDGSRSGIQAADPDGISTIRLTEYKDRIGDASKIPWEEMAFGFFPELERELNAIAADVIVTNSLDSAIVGASVAGSLDVPLVTSMHEQEPESEPFGKGKCSLVYGRLSPDAVLAGGKMYEERALRFGTPRERVHLIYHGVDTERFSPSVDGQRVRQENGIRADQRLIVCAARQKERKGLHPLLRGFAAIAKSHPDTKLLFVGSVSSASPEYANHLQRLIDEHGLRDRVQVRTDYTFADMPEVFAASDLVAQPSLAEGLGLAVMEAMATGKPVITTRIAGVDEIFEQNSEAAVRVPPNNSAALANALDTLLSDSQRMRSLGEHGRRHIVNYFSEDAMNQATEAVLQKACSSHV